jgi:hypothetical protein
MSYLPTDPQSPQILWQHAQVPPQVVAPGFGDYDQVGDWAWEFYGPNVYAWEAPADSAPQPAPILPALSGLSGDCGCGGTCGGCGDHHGVGQFGTGTGFLGTNLFTTTDVSQWGWGEWACVAAAIYVGGSLIGDIGGIVSGGMGAYRGSQRRAKKRAQLQADLTGL